jgi:hypothetical protein
VITNGAERPEKALCLLRRLEPPHGSLTLTRGLVRILRSIVEPLVPSMLSSRHIGGWLASLSVITTRGADPAAANPRRRNVSAAH